MSETFSIVYDLGILTEEQRHHYKNAVSKFFGLDPATNWFDILWINDETTGMKKLQLYARRGTTDVLRGQRGINVKSMTQHDGPGYVSFTAVGQDANGRQEIAVGAHSTEGLKGEKLAAAVSTAETRAGRRLTLKFVGLGILDYSEVNQDAPLSAPAPDVQLVGSPTVIPPMPTVAPNPAPAALATPSPADVVAEGMAALAARPVDYTAAVAALGPDMARDAGVVEHANAEPEPVVPKVRKTRKKKNTVDISLPGQVSASAEVSVPLAAAKEPEGVTGGIPQSLSTPPLAETQYHVPLPPHVGTTVVVVPQPGIPAAAVSVAVAETPKVPVDFPGKPTKEQEESYRTFLREYANNILPSAGMTPSENIGGASAKLRLFAERMSGKPTSQMTTTDWDDFIAFFPGFLARNSPKNLVKYINDVIGVK